MVTLNVEGSWSKEEYAMKKIIYSLILVLLLVAAFPAAVSAEALQDDKVVLGGSYSLADGETLDGSLIIIGGTASLAEGSTVTGDIVLTGGTITAGGSIEGDVILIGGSATFQKSVHVYGNLISTSSSINQAEGAVIDGKIQEHATIPFQLPFLTSKPALPGGNPASEHTQDRPDRQSDHDCIRYRFPQFYPGNPGDGTIHVLP